jgi:glutathione synthase/RimK-type ligase-like ATP-grasp enzyme
MVKSVLFTNPKNFRGQNRFIGVLKNHGIRTCIGRSQSNCLEQADQVDLLLHAQRRTATLDKPLQEILNRSLHRTHWMRGNPNVENKNITNQLVTSHGIKIPDFCTLPEFLDHDYSGPKPKFPLMIKYVYGSLGKEIYKVDNEDQLNLLLNTLRHKQKLYQVQEFIQTAPQPNTSASHRLFTFGEEVIGHAINTQEQSHVSNLHAGGQCQLQDLRGNAFEALRDAAINVARLFKSKGLLWGGQDWLLDIKTGQPFFLEVNSVPGFQSLGTKTKAEGFSILARKLKKYDPS